MIQRRGVGRRETEEERKEEKRKGGRGEQEGRKERRQERREALNPERHHWIDLEDITGSIRHRPVALLVWLLSSVHACCCIQTRQGCPGVITEEAESRWDMLHSFSTEFMT